MYLKAELAPKRDLQALKRMLHRLDDLWAAFKNEDRTTDLERFNSTIAALHGFEKIRYPDHVLKSGMFAIAHGPGLHGGGVLMAGSSGSKAPTYSLSMDEVDELIVERLWPTLGVREGFVPSTLAHLTKDGHRALSLRNRPLKRLFRQARRR